MRGILIISLLCTQLGVLAQQTNIPLNNDVWRVYDSELRHQDVHTAFRPLRYAELEYQLDTVLGEVPIAFFRNAYGDGTSDNVTAYGLFDIGFGYDASDTLDPSFLNMGVGVGLDITLTDKFAFHGAYFTMNAAYPDYIDTNIAGSNVVRGMGYAHLTGLGREFSQIEGYVSYSPNDIFNFQAGYGKNFIGDGYRSLMLSDNAINYPYLKITTDVWKVKYTNLFTAMKDIRFYDGTSNDSIRHKFTSVHHLSWNVARWLNIGLFESIIWQARDTLLNRGYDINYLNPFIFYRPVEFSVGSPDNALMGMNLKITPHRDIQLYGQLVLDEFLLDNLREQNGWWANKYGIQGGFKWFDVAGVDGLQLQFEANMVRPFTYSHGEITQNYGHMNQALAHPLGANFTEVNGVLSYRKGRWLISDQIVIADYGTDIYADSSYGGNIYQSYDNRIQDYGNEIGQGYSNKVMYNNFKVQYLIEEHMNLMIEAGHIFRNQSTPDADHTTNFVYLKLRTNLWNQYTDY